MKISGTMVLRNAVKLQYPFEVAIRSLRALCDEVVILVDPTSEDDTVDRVRALPVDKVVLSVWNMDNHDGHHNCEISVQTQKVCDEASGDWIFSLQADEVLHEQDVDLWRNAITYMEQGRVGTFATALEVCRLYFYGDLAQLRVDWSINMVRLFKRGCWKPDVDGAMRFDPIGEQRRWSYNPSNWMNDPSASLLILSNPRIYHYSRVGDPQVIANRVRNLDGFFHTPDKIKSGELDPYDFSTTRKLDTYVIGHETEVDPNARIVPFPLASHPKAVLEHFGVKL